VNGWFRKTILCNVISFFGAKHKIITIAVFDAFMFEKMATATDTADSTSTCVMIFLNTVLRTLSLKTIKIKHWDEEKTKKWTNENCPISKVNKESSEYNPSINEDLHIVIDISYSLEDIICNDMKLQINQSLILENAAMVKYYFLWLLYETYQ
jgi:hypothetical protein